MVVPPYPRIQVPEDEEFIRWRDGVNKILELVIKLMFDLVVGVKSRAVYRDDSEMIAPGKWDSDGHNTLVDGFWLQVVPGHEFASDGKSDSVMARL